jgi:GNAT superfamily N-acetyltransferase
MTEADLEAVLPLIAAYQRFYRAEPDDARNRSFFRRFLAPSDRGLLLGAWIGGDLVAFATLYWTFSSTEAAEIVLMNDLFVVPDRRGTGVGRALIDASMSVASERGAHHLEWLTATDNHAALRLYDRVGASRSSWFGYEIPTPPSA